MIVISQRLEYTEYYYGNADHYEGDFEIKSFNDTESIIEYLAQRLSYEINLPIEFLNVVLTSIDLKPDLLEVETGTSSIYSNNIELQSELRKKIKIRIAELAVIKKEETKQKELDKQIKDKEQKIKKELELLEQLKAKYGR